VTSHNSQSVCVWNLEFSSFAHYNVTPRSQTSCRLGEVLYHALASTSWFPYVANMKCLYPLQRYTADN